MLFMTAFFKVLTAYISAVTGVLAAYKTNFAYIPITAFIFLHAKKFFETVCITKDDIILF